MDTIDRIAPTRRPEGRRPAQHQTWETLLFLHWRVPVEALRPLVPAELEIDTFDGSAWVGHVPFTMKGVRPAWLPAVPGTSDSHETNHRTYVHHKGRDPGVWFFTLEAAAWLPVQVARAGWHLPYHYARMSLTRGADGVIDYATERRAPPPLPAHFKGRYRPDGVPSPAVPGTLEHFLAERYFLFADTGGGRIQRGQVHHAPYPLQTAAVLSWEESLCAACGIARPDEEPIAHYAEGVQVEIFDLVDL